MPLTGGAAGRRVLVTGATGFVGRHVVTELASHGWQVRAMVRRAGVALPDGVEAILASDVADRGALRGALPGCDAVVHLAARVHVMRDRAADPLAEFRRANVEATRVVLEEAARAGVRRLVLASSVKAVGESSEAPWTEATSPSPPDPYGRSKLEAERLVGALAPASGVEPVILRFPLVYGPGVRANMLRLFQLVYRGVPLPFGGLRNRRSLLFSGNAAAAVRHALDLPTVADPVFFVADDEDLSTPDLVRRIGLALGRPARLVPCPVTLLRAVGRLGDAAERLAPFPVTTRAVDRLVGSLAVDVGRLRRSGFSPPVSVDEGLGRTAAWFRGALAADGATGH